MLIITIIFSFYDDLHDDFIEDMWQVVSEHSSCKVGKQMNNSACDVHVGFNPI